MIWFVREAGVLAPRNGKRDFPSFLNRDRQSSSMTWREKLFSNEELEGESKNEGRNLGI